jgi:hypothetical protein
MKSPDIFLERAFLEDQLSKVGPGSIPFTSTPLERIWLRRLLHVDFELVLRRPIETAPFIGTDSIERMHLKPTECSHSSPRMELLFGGGTERVISRRAHKPHVV